MTRMSFTRRRALPAALAALALVLAGCASIPTEGPVTEGDGEVAPTEPFIPFAEGPQPDDGPTAIVRGFLQASAAGVASDFSVAREFLTSDASVNWNPGARVTVFNSGALNPEVNQDEGRVTYFVPVAATLDDSGRMLEAAADERLALDFHVVEDAQGQWRISQLDDGVLISEANFNSFFRPIELEFATPGLDVRVPELRWLPQNNGATYAARELIEGPSLWLADAVVTGFPPASALVVDSVVVTDGVAAVELTSESAGSPTERALAGEQLELTLTGLAGVSAVDATIAGLPLGGDGTVRLERAPVPDGNAAVFVDGRLGVWDGSDLWAVPADQGRLPDGASGLAQSFGSPVAAFLVGQSQLVVTGAIAGGPRSLEFFDPDTAPDAAQPESVMETTTVHTGTELVEPSFDRHGWIWTAERSGTGGLVAVRADGSLAAIEAPWLEGRDIRALAVSHDGARIAIASISGGQPVVEVAGVVRGGNGVPSAVTEPLSVGTGVGVPIDIAWMNTLSVAVLGLAPDSEAPSPLWLLTVGGRTDATDTVIGATGITARNGEPSLTVTAEDETVRERAGTSWSAGVTHVTEIAYAG